MVWTQVTLLNRWQTYSATTIGGALSSSTDSYQSRNGPTSRRWSTSWSLNFAHFNVRGLQCTQLWRRRQDRRGWQNRPPSRDEPAPIQPNSLPDESSISNPDETSRLDSRPTPQPNASGSQRRTRRHTSWSWGWLCCISCDHSWGWAYPYAQGWLVECLNPERNWS